MANLEERRGKGSSGRPYSKELSVRRVETKIKLVDIGNEFLKKLKALERQEKQDKH